MRNRTLRIVLVVVIAALGAVFGPPLVFLGNVWLHDGATVLPPAPAGTNDASRMSVNRAAEVIAVAAEPAAAEQQLAALVRRAVDQHLHLSIVGAHHSMGGHTIYPGGIALDMRAFNRISLDEKERVLTVGAGARWSEIISFLDHRGLAVLIMQTNNDFSVGGSISVNCHGWQNDTPPIASTVQAFRILTADGQIRRCNRNENRELFSLALGGYGLFGVILEVELRVVPNDFYVAEAHRVKPADYNRVYHELTKNRDEVRMAYGRINVAPTSFLEDGIVTVLKRQPAGRAVTDTLEEFKPSLLKRLVFRGGIGSDYGKNLRWWLENAMGETAGKLLSRNQIMQEPATLYASRDPATADILHEYFLPVARMGEFVAKARPVFLKYRPELLNITVRNVETDQDTFLRYAPEEMFGLVMLFHQRCDSAGEAAMQALTRELIDVALACGGRYYLPYRPHATVEQFERAYPMAREFFALKQRYDPAGVFENTFFLNYGKALSAAQP